jgi:hypothetical protein
MPGIRESGHGSSRAAGIGFLGLKYRMGTNAPIVS